MSAYAVLPAMQCRDCAEFRGLFGRYGPAQAGLPRCRGRPGDPARAGGKSDAAPWARRASRRCCRYRRTRSPGDAVPRVRRPGRTGLTTCGREHDEEVLEQLRKNSTIPYIGMSGARTRPVCRSKISGSAAGSSINGFTAPSESGSGGTARRRSPCPSWSRSCCSCGAEAPAAGGSNGPQNMHNAR